MIRNRNIFGVDGGIHTKNGGKTYASYACSFPTIFWVDTSINPQKITMVP